MTAQGFVPLPGSDPEVSRALVRIEAVYDRLAQDARTAVGQFNREMANAGQGVQQGMTVANRAIDETRNKSQLLFTTILVGAAAAAAGIAAVIGASTRQAIQYEQAFAGVRRTVDATEKDLARLNVQFIQMSKETTTTAAGLAEIATAAGAVGVAAGDIATFVKSVDTLTLATDIGAGQATQSLGVLGAQLGLVGDQYERVTSTVVALSNKMAATGQQVLTTAERAGTAAQRLGLGPEALLAYSAALNSVGGVEQGQAGTILNNLFGTSAQIASGSREAESAAARLGVTLEQLKTIQQQGGAAAEYYARSLGMTAEELNRLISMGEAAREMARVSGQGVGAFRQGMEEDPAAALQRFLTGLGKLDAYAQENVLRKIGLGDEASQRGLMALAANMEDLNTALATGPEAWRENSAAQEAAAKQLDTVAGRVAMLRNQFTAIQLEIGEKFLPVLKEALTWISDNLPAAWEAVKDVWDRTLYPAVKRLTDALMVLGQTAADIFLNWGNLMGEAGTGAEAAENGLDGLAQVLAVVVGYVTAMVNGINSLLQLPFVKEFIQFGLALGVVAGQLKIIQALVGGTRSIVGGAFNALTGGRFAPGAAVSPESQAMMSAAGAHQQAAGALMGAAAALQGSSAMSPFSVPVLRTGLNAGRAGGPWVPGNFGPTTGPFQWNMPTTMQGWRQRDAVGSSQWERNFGRYANVMLGNVGRPGFVGSQQFMGPQMDRQGFTWRGAGQIGRDMSINPITGMPGSYALDNGMPIAIGNNPQSKMRYLDMERQARQAAMNSAQRMVDQTRHALSEGITKASEGLRGGLSRLGGAVSSGLQLAGRVFWGAMIADMVANIAAAPIGNILANSPGRARLRIAAQQGWAELVAGWFEAERRGTDTYVARQPSYMMGGREYGTEDLARARVAGSDLDAMEGGGIGALLAQRRSLRTLQEYVSGNRNYGDIGYLQGIAQSAGVTLDPNLAQAGNAANFMRGIPIIGSTGAEAAERWLSQIDLASTPSGRKALADLQTAMTDGINDSTAEIGKALADAIHATGLDTPDYLLGRLTDPQSTSLAGVAEWAGGAGAGGSLLLRFATQQMTGQFTRWMEGGAEALATNTEELRKNADAYVAWREKLAPAEEAAFEAAREFIMLYGEEFPRAAAAGDEAKRQLLAKMPLTEDERRSLATPEGLAEIWTQWWEEGFSAIMGAGGYDQQQRLAQEVQNIVSNAFAGGMNVDEIRNAMGPQWNLLFDGIGDDVEDRARRIADAFWDAFGEQFRNADTTAEQEAFAQKMESVLGITLPGSTTAQRFGAASNFRIQSMLDEIMVADPQGRIDIANRLRTDLGANAPPTWDETVRRALPGMQDEWRNADPTGRASLLEAFNRARGDLGPGQSAWTAADIEQVMGSATDLTDMLATAAQANADSAAANTTATDTNTSSTDLNTQALDRNTAAQGGEVPAPNSEPVLIDPQTGIPNRFPGGILPDWFERSPMQPRTGATGTSSPPAAPATPGTNYADLMRERMSQGAASVAPTTATAHPATSVGTNFSGLQGGAYVGARTQSTQNVNVQTMNVGGQADEQSLVRQFSFLSNGR